MRDVEVLLWTTSSGKRLRLGGVQRWCGFELKLGASIYRRIEGVVVNGIAPASNYDEAVAWQGA